MRQYFTKKCKSKKLNSSKPYIDEFTVFIKVKIESLKELSKPIPLRVSKIIRNIREPIKMIMDKKYL